ncbi:ATP-grasp domain-containing protein [Aurantivibrio infirmus]
MKRILFMSEEEARTTLYCAGLSGDYEFYVVGNLEKNKTIQFHPMCAKFIPLNAELGKGCDSAKVVDELIEIIKRDSIDILLPVSITCMQVVDEFKEKLRALVLIAPFPDSDCVRLLDDKYNFYLFCKENGIAHPESAYVENSLAINPENPAIPYPLLIKPTLGAGGFDTLIFCKTKSDMDKFLAKPSEEKEKYFPALLQEFFEGEDIDFNGFSVDGKVIASSVMRTDFYEDDISLSFTSFVKNDDVDALGRKILEVSKYSGPTNIDMRIRASDGKLMLIEVNPRYWARVMVSLMDGMNFVEAGIKTTLGEEVDLRSKCPNKIWISYMGIFVKAILKGKLSYLKYFFMLSTEQIRYIIFNKKFYKYANKMLGEK